jgi:hypothetical protein
MPLTKGLRTLGMAVMLAFLTAALVLSDTHRSDSHRNPTRFVNAAPIEGPPLADETPSGRWPARAAP